MSYPALLAESLTKRFAGRDGNSVTAVEDVSFQVAGGECVGVVGGSGGGKSTVARMATGLVRPTSGKVLLGGIDVAQLRCKDRMRVTSLVQMVFQNPAASFDSKRTLGQGAAEALRNQGMGRRERQAVVRELFLRCGLPEGMWDRYPREVSGGQCQRAAIARALAPNPRLVVLDEATSALDVTVPAQILDLLREVRAERHASYLFVCHDLAVAQGFCDRLLVMWQGRVVEEGTVEQVLMDPQHDYTKQLIEASL